MKKLIIAFLFPICVFAQSDLLSEIETKTTPNKVGSAFKSLKIVNFESTKLVGKGDMYFVVAHRFDFLNQGIYDFFGLDEAVTQLKFAYGLTDGLSLQVARSGFQKTYDLSAKYLVFSQLENGFPVTIVGFSSMAINTEMTKELYPLIQFKNRLNFVNQLLISRKVNDNLSLELAPSFLHENTVRDLFDANGKLITPNPQNNNQFIVGFGGRYKFAKRWSLNMDYGAHLNRANQSIYKNPMSIGFDLETGGHVFQMHLTNAKAMNEAGFLGQTTGDWTKGEISFGFNLVRVF